MAENDTTVDIGSKEISATLGIVKENLKLQYLLNMFSGNSAFCTTIFC